LKPRFFLDAGVVEGLQKPLQELVIFKLLGKFIAYFALMDKLKLFKNLQVDFISSVYDIDTFMVKSDVREDHEKVFEEGHWMIFDYYLAVSD